MFLNDARKSRNIGVDLGVVRMQGLVPFSSETVGGLAEQVHLFQTHLVDSPAEAQHIIGQSLELGKVLR